MHKKDERHYALDGHPRPVGLCVICKNGNKADDEDDPDVFIFLH